MGPSLSRFAACLCLLLLAAAGCGEDGDSSAGLTWKDDPRVVKPEGLPKDRVVSGEVQNDSLRRVDLTAKDLTLRDAAGDRVEGVAIFVSSFLHGLYPPTREPSSLPESELRRTGRIARIEPGKSVPLTVSWRLSEGEKPPVRVEYGSGSLPIP